MRQRPGLCFHKSKSLPIDFVFTVVSLVTVKAAFCATDSRALTTSMALLALSLSSSSSSHEGLVLVLSKLSPASNTFYSTKQSSVQLQIGVIWSPNSSQRDYCTHQIMLSRSCILQFNKLIPAAAVDSRLFYRESRISLLCCCHHAAGLYRHQCHFNSKNISISLQNIQSNVLFLLLQLRLK